MTSIKRKDKQKQILAEIEELNLEEDQANGKMSSGARPGSGVRVVFDEEASMFEDSA